METKRKSMSGGERRSHTKFSFGVVLLVGIVACIYQSIQPLPPKIVAVVTSRRVKLRDGRHLAYREFGVPKDEARYKIVYIHGFDSSKHDSLSPTLLDELKIYIVSFDRPGYGESDPDPNRSPRSIAFDVEELADGLGLGSKFYLLGFSIGGQITWSCLHYIPHRLAGAALVAPAINYWWKNLPTKMSKEAYSSLLPRDQWALRVAHYTPWLTFWWNTQKWFSVSSYIAGKHNILSRQDKEILSKMGTDNSSEVSNVHILNLASIKKYVRLVYHRVDFVGQTYIRQQGEYESLHRDLMIAFGHWEFDPLDLQDPFKNTNGSVHLWHGDEDMFVPVLLQRFIVSKLPWVRYHEATGSGHLFPFIPEMIDKILKTLCVEED